MKNINTQYCIVLEKKASSLTEGCMGLSMTEQANCHYYYR